MRMKSPIRTVIRITVRSLCPAFARRATPSPSTGQLTFEQITHDGLRLREALPVRTAEYWLELGHPALALKELEALPASARQQPWPLRGRLAALRASSSLGA